MILVNVEIDFGQYSRVYAGYIKKWKLQA